jgi:acyl carrier protein
MTITNSEARQVLREWICSKARSVDESTITDQTLIIEDGLISSVDVLELFMLIEELGEIEIDATELEPGMLGSIDMICQTFLD